jgi:hypothetical protein
MASGLVSGRGYILVRLLEDRSSVRRRVVEHAWSIPRLRSGNVNALDVGYPERAEVACRSWKHSRAYKSKRGEGGTQS